MKGNIIKTKTDARANDRKSIQRRKEDRIHICTGVREYGDDGYSYVADWVTGKVCPLNCSLSDLDTSTEMHGILFEQVRVIFANASSCSCIFKGYLSGDDLLV